MRSLPRSKRTAAPPKNHQHPQHQKSHDFRLSIIFQGLTLHHGSPSRLGLLGVTGRWSPSSLHPPASDPVAGLSLAHSLDRVWQAGPSDKLSLHLRMDHAGFSGSTTHPGSPHLGHSLSLRSHPDQCGASLAISRSGWAIRNSVEWVNRVTFPLIFTTRHHSVPHLLSCSWDGFDAGLGPVMEKWTSASPPLPPRCPFGFSSWTRHGRNSASRWLCPRCPATHHAVRLDLFSNPLVVDPSGTRASVSTSPHLDW